jgi:pilus assembly protein FimV
MFRKSALAMAMWGALAAQSALALGLGDIELKSTLNQPLRAEVQLLSVTERELQELRVALAAPEVFQRAGIDRPAFLTRINFEPVRKPDGSAVIQITSRESVREPFLDFMLEVVWANGKLVRAYTVLVDPPVTMPAPAPATQAPVSTAPVPTAQPRAAAPRATTPPPAADVGTRSGDTYGPTGRNDTLWNIAAKVRPDGVGMEQAMLGLLRANPDAFIGHNINNLKAGYVLRIPDRAEFTSIGTADASAEVRTQNREWREGRVRPTRAEAAAPMPAPTPAAEPVAPSRLELTAPDDGEAVGTAATAGEGADLDALRRELVLATEAAEVQRAQSEQLESRLQVLEEQIAKMQRLIELKDDQLALLASQSGMETPEEAAPDAVPGEPGGVDALEAELFLGEDLAPEAETETMPGEELMVTPEPEEAAPQPSMAPTPPQTIPVEPPPFEESRSLLDRVLANPLWLGAGVALLALLAVLGLRRRSSSEPEFQESILQEREERPTRASAPVVPDVPAAEPEPKSRSRESDSSLLSEFATSDLGAIQNQSEADPLAEADVYLAYGRYQQAEDLIRDALEEDPDREDFNLKLFEIYAAAQNRSGFDAHAEQVLARLESQEHPLWLKVAEMGRELSPDNPLYQPGGAPVAPLDSSADTPAASKEDNSLDFDLGLDDDDAGLTSQEPPLDEMDFDLDTATEEPKPATPEEAEPLDFDLGGEEERKPETVEADDLDFGLGDLDLGGADLETEEESGEGLLSDMDEVATKLDLARAYIDMGDPDGARSILEEVLQEGSEAQQDEARELLGQL